KVLTMLGCCSSMQMAPSLGFFRPRKRSSNFFVLTLSSSFTQTVRPRLRSRARHTLDMLPCPVRLSRSKRFLTLMIGRFSLPFLEPPNHFLRFAKKPMAGGWWLVVGGRRDGSGRGGRHSLYQPPPTNHHPPNYSCSQ